MRYNMASGCFYVTSGCPFFIHDQSYLVLVAVILLPFVIIAVCNVLIVKSLRTRARFLRTCDQPSSNRMEEQAGRQTTVMCLAVSCLFLFCMTPSLILLAGKPSWKSRDGYVIAKAVSNLLAYVNHSCNFVLYCLCARRFRKELLNMLRYGQMKVARGYQLARRASSD